MHILIIMHGFIIVYMLDYIFIQLDGLFIKKRSIWMCPNCILSDWNDLGTFYKNEKGEKFEESCLFWFILNRLMIRKCCGLEVTPH